jgi:hypothetical protein
MWVWGGVVWEVGRLELRSRYMYDARGRGRCLAWERDG